MVLDSGLLFWATL